MPAVPLSPCLVVVGGLKVAEHRPDPLPALPSHARIHVLVSLLSPRFPDFHRKIPDTIAHRSRRSFQLFSEPFVRIFFFFCAIYGAVYDEESFDGKKKLGKRGINREKGDLFPDLIEKYPTPSRCSRRSFQLFSEPSVRIFFLFREP